MAKGIYVGSESVKEMTSGYVGVDGAVKQIKEIYIGVDGVVKKVFPAITEIIYLDCSEGDYTFKNCTVARQDTNYSQKDQTYSNTGENIKGYYSSWFPNVSTSTTINRDICLAIDFTNIKTLNIFVSGFDYGATTGRCCIFITDDSTKPSNTDFIVAPTIDGVIDPGTGIFPDPDDDIIIDDGSTTQGVYKTTGQISRNGLVSSGSSSGQTILAMEKYYLNYSFEVGYTGVKYLTIRHYGNSSSTGGTRFIISKIWAE